MISRLNRLFRFSLSQRLQELVEKKKLKQQAQDKSQNSVSSLEHKQIKEYYKKLIQQQSVQPATIQQIETKLNQQVQKHPTILQQPTNYSSPKYFSRSQTSIPCLTYQINKINFTNMSDKQQQYFHTSLDPRMTRQQTWLNLLNSRKIYTPLDVKLMNKYKKINVSERIQVLTRTTRKYDRFTVYQRYQSARVACKLYEFQLEGGQKEFNINVIRVIKVLPTIEKIPLNQIPFITTVVYEFSKLSLKIQSQQFTQCLNIHKKNLFEKIGHYFQPKHLRKALQQNSIQVFIMVHHLICIFKKNRLPEELKATWVNILKQSNFRAPDNTRLLLEVLVFLKHNNSFQYVPIVQKQQVEGIKSLKNLELFWDYVSNCGQEKNQRLKVMIAEQIVRVIRQTGVWSEHYQNLIRKITNNRYCSLPPENREMK